MLMKTEQEIKTTEAELKELRLKAKELRKKIEDKQKMKSLAPYLLPENSGRGHDIFKIR